MQAKAESDLARLFTEQLAAAGLAAQSIETYATPRRFALIARGLPEATEALREETKGPRTSAPPQALHGFLRKTGLTQDQLEERDGIWFAIADKPGRSTASVLAEAVPAVIRAFPWPKSMRWGEASAAPESQRWVRPLQGIVALFGEEIVEFEVAGVKSGAATVGHRFHHPGIITIGSANDYVEKLRACHVIVDAEERRRIIRNAAEVAAEACGLHLVEDEGLVAENAGLTEMPVPLLGRFDPAFLDVPPEVIQLTMRTNQKYFALQDGQGRLAPNFICTANVLASDNGAAIIRGNEKVLAARLSDARFFWEQDLKIPLEEQAKKLGQIVFHEKLGTVADKVERVAKLARWLVEEGIVKGAQPDLAERAARLAKADLVTGMVGEFPELQGLIGGYLARAQRERQEVADAIRDHYKPVGQGDEVPTAPVTVAVSLADKLDTIAGFFSIDEKPTGSKDPFALRRAALGVIRLIFENNVRTNLHRALVEATYRQPFGLSKDPTLLANEAFSEVSRFIRMGRDVAIEFYSQLRGQADEKVVQRAKDNTQKLYDLSDEELLFFADRLKVQQREAGVRHDLIDAVFALGGEDDLVRLLDRVRALQAFVETTEGADLLAGYKRAANILKKEGWHSPSPPPAGERAGERGESGELQAPDGSPVSAPSPPPSPPEGGEGEQGANKPLSYSPEPEEAALIAALDSAAPRASAAVAAEDFEGAMAALASLRGPVDAFFDKVTVNDPDPAKREARLALLARMRGAVHQVADFSRIEG